MNALNSDCQCLLTAFEADKRCLRLGRGTDNGAYINTRAWGNTFQIRCSEIGSEALFVPKCL